MLASNKIWINEYEFYSYSNIAGLTSKLDPTNSTRYQRQWERKKIRIANAYRQNDIPFLQSKFGDKFIKQFIIHNMICSCGSSALF